MALSSAQSLAGITSDGSPRVTEAMTALAARRPNGWMKRKDMILAVSNNLSQEDEMNEWKGCEAEDHQSLADGWHASHIKILDNYIVIFIQVNYPGFLLAGVIPPCPFFFYFPTGSQPPQAPLQDRMHGGVACVRPATLVWSAMRGRDVRCH